MDSSHIPVLMDETLNALSVKSGGRYVDGTLGRGGHAHAIAERGGIVLGIDRDDAAIAAVRAQGLSGITTVKGNHGDLKQIANEHGWNEVDGVLLDLGVSSPQLDEPGRGFSFLRDGPLDMRMDRSSEATAADIVNGESAERLADIFRSFGEEPQARRIAKAAVAARANGTRFSTTAELAGFIERLVGRRGGRHPATRVFQALRMAVNDELGELARALDGAISILRPGGRLAVISFESLSDRMVKRFFVAHIGRMRALQGGGAEWSGSLPRVRPVIRRAVRAAETEISNNPRARSAKLRAVERI